MSVRTYENREFKRRNVDVKTRLEALHEAVDLGRPWLSAQTVARSEKWLSIARGRLEQSLDHTVVALAGPTGAGKSSLTNALVGVDVASVSVKRPTTSQALAVVWDSAEEGRQAAAQLLDWLDIPERHYRSGEETAPASSGRRLFGAKERESSASSGAGTKDKKRPMQSGLIVVDLPDFDSVIAEHRVRADHLTERADLLVWVTDPQKYADAILHQQYLKKFANHTHMVVVLNQADRLSAGAKEQCLDDIKRLLAKDGITGATTLAVSTKTGEGISELSSLLSIAAARRAAQAASLVADLKDAAQTIVTESGGTPAGAIPQAAIEELNASLSNAAGVDAITDAVYGSALRRSHIATGWPPTAWLARLGKDPLRTLGLTERWIRSDKKNKAGRSVKGSEEVIRPATARSSMTSHDSRLEAKASTAVRNFVSAQSAGGPIDWQMNLRSQVGDTDLSDQLDAAISNSPSIVLGRPRWWKVVSFLHKVLLILLAAGLLWLTLLAVASYLQMDVPSSPSWMGFPVPTVLTFVGLVGGILLGLLSRLFSLVHARRVAQRTYSALNAQIATVANKYVVEPVRAARTRLESCVMAALVASR